MHVKAGAYSIAAVNDIGGIRIAGNGHGLVDVLMGAGLIFSEDPDIFFQGL